MAKKTCPLCNGAMDNGYVAAHGRNVVDYTTLNPSGKQETVTMDAYACFQCGYVAHFVDPTRLQNTARMQ